MKHVHVHTKSELQNALIKSQHEEVDYVIEVESSIDANANFHSNLRQFSCRAADHAFSTISQLSVLNSFSKDSMSIKVCKLEYFKYRSPLDICLLLFYHDLLYAVKIIVITEFLYVLH